MSKKQDDQDRKAAEMSVMGLEYDEIGRQLGMAAKQAHDAVQRGLALMEAERPAESIKQYEQICVLLARLQERADKGDRQAARAARTMRSALRDSAAIARHYNPGWQPEPRPEQRS